MTSKSFLKKIHHSILFRLMVRKKSHFGNDPNKIEGILRPIESDKVNPSFRDKKIAVIVLNRNNMAIIRDCIDRLIKFNAYNYQIIVIDNQSTDGSFEMLKKEYIDTITLIKHNKNGCSTGRNLGVSVTDADYLFFFDSDQGPLRYGWLDRFLYILNKYKDVGAVGYAGGYFTQNDMTGPTFEHYPDNNLPNKYLFRTNIDYLCTSGLLVRRTVFDTVKGFDPEYDPHCFEDADLSRKIVSSGYKIAYCKDLPVYHEAHTTTQASGNNKEYYKLFAEKAKYFKNKWLT